MSNTTNTVRLHRVLRAPAERLYRAFLDPDAMVKWLPPHGFTGKVHQMDAKVGGSYKMSFTNFSTGKSHAFGGKYTDLTPHTRIQLLRSIFNDAKIVLVVEADRLLGVLTKIDLIDYMASRFRE